VLANHPTYPGVFSADNYKFAVRQKGGDWEPFLSCGLAFCVGQAFSIPKKKKFILKELGLLKWYQNIEDFNWRGMWRTGDPRRETSEGKVILNGHASDGSVELFLNSDELALSLDQEILAVINSAGDIHLYETDDMNFVAGGLAIKPRRDKEAKPRIQFAPDGKFLVISIGDKVRLIEKETTWARAFED